MTQARKSRTPETDKQILARKWEIMELWTGARLPDLGFPNHLFQYIKSHSEIPGPGRSSGSDQAFLTRTDRLPYYV